MRFILLFCFLFPHLLFSASQIALVTDFPPGPLETGTPKEQTPIFYLVQRSLANQEIDLAVSDLKSFHLPTNKQKGWFRRHAKNTKAITHFVFWNIPSFAKRLDLSSLPKEKMVLFIWEPPTVQPHLHKQKFHSHFSKIFTFDDTLVDGKRYFKYYCPSLKHMRLNLPPFEKRKLCTQIVTNKTSKHPHELYSERERVIQFFETRKAGLFEFYGFGWEPKEYQTYLGTVDDKIDTLMQYRFSICYENIDGIHGYITEKIFDCFAAGTIPIYLGAPNIEKHIPKSCFIDRRDFNSDEALFSFLINFSKDDYEAYLKNIRNFLESEKAAYFSSDYFIKTFQQAIDNRVINIKIF